MDAFWPDGCRDFTDIMIRRHFEQMNAYGREQGAREILRSRDPEEHHSRRSIISPNAPPTSAATA